MTTIKLRRGTAAEWTTANPILAAGEMGIETDTRKFKFGDGTTPWNTLAYASAEGGGGTGDVTAAGDNTFTGENTFNGAVNLNGVSIAENLTVKRNLTSNGEINAVSIKTTGLRSDDIQTTTNKKYLTEVDVDNQTIQMVDGKLHANLDTKQDILSDGNGTKINTNKVDINQGTAGIQGLSIYEHTGTVTVDSNRNLVFNNGAFGYIFLPNKGINNNYEIVLHLDYLGNKGSAQDAAINMVMCTSSTQVPLLDGTELGGYTIDTYDTPFRAWVDRYQGDSSGITIDTITYQKITIKGTTLKLQTSPNNSTYSDIVSLSIEDTNNIVIGIANRLWTMDINNKWTNTILYSDSYVLDKSTNTYLMKSGTSPEGVAVATSTKYGLVLPDNSTIVSNNGVLSSITPNNVVTTDTQQTISSAKTFFATQYFKSGIGLNGETYNFIRVFKNNTPITLAQYAGDVYLGDLDNETVIQGSTKIKLDATTLTHKLDNSTEATIVDSSNVSTYATGLPFPSNRYINLTPGANGTSYIAPADGWIAFAKKLTATGQFVCLSNNTISMSTMGCNATDGSGGNTSCFIPCKKGDEVVTWYSAGGDVLNLMFIYAEGVQ